MSKITILKIVGFIVGLLLIFGTTGALETNDITIQSALLRYLVALVCLVPEVVELRKFYH